MGQDTPFGFEKPQDSPGFLLWQTTIDWQRRIKNALQPYPLSHAQFVLMALTLWFETNDKKPTQAILTDWSKLDKMTVSKALRELTKLGFVSRQEDPEDTRAKVVQLSSTGKNLVQELVPIVEAVDAEFFARLGDGGQKILIKLLWRLNP